MWVFAAPFKTRSEFEAENLVLRHRRAELHRSAPRRAKLGSTDRLLFVLLYRFCPQVLNAIVIIRPETVVRRHPPSQSWKTCLRNHSDGTASVDFLLQQVSHALLSWPRYTDFTPCTARRADHLRPSTRRTASFLRPDSIFGNDSQECANWRPKLRPYLTTAKNHPKLGCYFVAFIK